jgi:hypothetical protein
MSLSVNPETTTTYTVSVTGSNGCPYTASSTVLVHVPQAVSLDMYESSGNSSGDGYLCTGDTAILTASGNGISFVWNNNETESYLTVNPESATTYAVTMTDLQGCTSTASTILWVNPLPSVEIEPVEISGIFNDDAVICSGDEVGLRTGGNSQYSSYSWSTGDSFQAIIVNPTVSSAYSVEVKDDNGCFNKDSVYITVNFPPDVSITYSDSSGAVFNDGLVCNDDPVTLTATGIWNSYFWSTSPIRFEKTVTIYPEISTDYTVIVSDFNNCITSATALVQVQPVFFDCPSNLTVSTDTDLCGAILAGIQPHVDNICDSFSLVQASGLAEGEVFPPGTTVQKFVAYHSNGYAADSCEYTVTVVDTQSPVAVCLDTSVQIVAANGTYVTVYGNELTVNSYDNCGGLLVSSPEQINYSLLNTGVNQVYFTMTDISGNTSTCVSLVTVSCYVAPEISVDTIICPGGTATLLAGNGESYMWSNGATDASVSVTPVSTTTYTVTVTDSNGCTGTAATVVTVSEWKYQAVTIKGAKTVCEGGYTTLEADFGSAFEWSTGDITPAIIVSPQSSSIYTVTVSENGCTTTATVTVNIGTDMPPIAVCEDVTVVLDNFGQATLSVTESLAGESFDYLMSCGFGPDAWSLTIPGNSTGVVSANSIQLSSADDSGMSFDTQARACVTVQENTTVIIEWNYSTIDVAPHYDPFGYELAGQFVSITEEWGDMTQSGITEVPVQSGQSFCLVQGTLDASSGAATTTCTLKRPVTFVPGEIPFSCSDVGIFPVTVAVTDEAGNTTECNSVITIVEYVPPVLLSCPPAQELFVDTACQVVIPDLIPEFYVYDDCSTPVVEQFPVAGETVSVGTAVVILTATDASSNTVTCQVELTVADTLAPVFTFCPENITISEEDCEPVAYYESPLAADNCGVVLVSQTAGPGSGERFYPGQNSLSFVATDDHGNTAECIFRIFVEDNIAPVSVCSDITVYLDGTGVSDIDKSLLGGGSYDNCELLFAGQFALNNWVQSENAGQISVSSSLVTLESLDDYSGNSTETSLCITSQEEADFEFSWEYRTLDLSPVWDPFGYSIDGVFTQLTPDTVGTDLSGNEHISLLPDQHFCFIQSTTDATGGGARTELTGLRRLVRLSTVPESLSYDCSNTGMSTVLLVVTDGSGNTNTCISTVTITDTLIPVYTYCPEGITQNNEIDSCGAFVTWIQPEAADNCSSLSIVQTDGIQSGGMFPVGESVVQYVATDAADNVAVCSFTVNVFDAQPPALLCKNVTVELSEGTATVTSSMIDDGSTDNCASALVFFPDSITYTCDDIGVRLITLTAVDDYGNSSTCTSSITVNGIPAAASITGDTEICLGDETELTAIGGVKYAWSNGSANASTSASPAATTSYTVTVTNSSGCVATASATVIVRELPVITLTRTDVSGLQYNDGIICAGASATLTATGGVSYEWSTGAVSNQIQVESSGTYSLKVTNQYGCTSTDGTDITVLPLPVPVVQVTDNSGSQPNDGKLCQGATAVLTASGGTTYLWSTGSSSESITTTVSGTYHVTVTNSNNCRASSSTPIVVSPLPLPAIGGVGAICRGTSATLIASGGTSFRWSTNAISSFITVSPQVTTTYTVTVTNAAGCTSSASRVLTVNALPSPNIVGPPTVCRGSSVVLTGEGGGSYLWSTGSTATSITVAPATTTVYAVTVTNENGCTARKSRSLLVRALPVASISGPSSVCSGSSISLTASGGATYSWSAESNEAVLTVSPLVTNTYTVTVTSADGCTATATRTITVNSLPVASVAAPQFVCNGSSGTLLASGGSTYLWNTGATNNSLAVSSQNAGTYTVTVTSAFGCSSTATGTIVVQNQPTVSLFAPTSGAAGTVITITGTNFTSSSTVKFNGTGVANVTFVSSTELRAVLPASGNLLNVMVTTPCGSADLTITNPVTITSFSPASGPAGTLVTINGTNLANAQSVIIGGVPSIIISNTATSVVGYVMPGATTGVITVATASGSVTTSTSFTVTPTPHPGIQQGSKLTGTISAMNSLVASSVAISADGNTAVVGGPGDNTNTGAIWIFVRNGTSWSQQGGKLVGSGGTNQAKQGFSVAISADGNTVVSGAQSDNSDMGAAWVFTRNGGMWSQQGPKLVGTGVAGVKPLMGTAVSISADGNTIALGGPGDQSNMGAVWIFRRTNGTWAQFGNKLVGTGAAGTIPRQGSAVALSADGKTLLSGGYQDAGRRGATWVFTFDGSSWMQQGNKLVGTGQFTDSYQGCSVALSANGNTALIGGNSDNTFRGAAWVFVRSGNTWSQQGAKLVGTAVLQFTRFGTSVSLSADGNTAVIGGFGDQSNAGAMWVYKRTGINWIQQGAKLTGSNASGKAKQGNSVSVSATGTTALTGGPGDATNKGACWVYVTGSQIIQEESDTRSENDQNELVFSLLQNIPNPFTGKTSVGFTLPEPCTAEWQITDMSGRVVLVLKRDYPAGENSETFELKGYSGVYWYTVKTPFGVLTRKMIIVER